MTPAPENGRRAEKLPRAGSRFRNVIRIRNFQALFGRFGRPGDLIFASGFMVLALALLLALPWQVVWAPRTRLYMQPGFWPGVAIACMVLFGAGHLLGALLSDRRPGWQSELLGWARSLEFAGWFLVYVWLVPLGGYLPVTILFTCALAFRMGYRSWRWMGLSGLFAVGVVVGFKSFLQVKIPAGAVYAYLPDGIRTFAMVNF